MSMSRGIQSQGHGVVNIEEAASFALLSYVDNWQEGGEDLKALWKRKKPNNWVAKGSSSLDLCTAHLLLFVSPGFPPAWKCSEREGICFLAGPLEHYKLIPLPLSFMTGMPFNQLGTLAGSKYYNVEATYCYLRWWVSVRILTLWTENQCTVVAGARFFSPLLWTCDCFRWINFRGEGREMGLFHCWAGRIWKNRGRTKPLCWSLKYMRGAAREGQGFVWDPLPVLGSQVWRGSGGAEWGTPCSQVGGIPLSECGLKAHIWKGV